MGNSRSQAETYAIAGWMVRTNVIAISLSVGCQFWLVWFSVLQAIMHKCRICKTEHSGFKGGVFFKEQPYVFGTADHLLS